MMKAFVGKYTSFTSRFSGYPYTKIVWRDDYGKDIPINSKEGRFRFNSHEVLPKNT